MFSLRIIALNHYVGFCRTSTWFSHRYMYVPSLLGLPPTPSNPSAAAAKSRQSCPTLCDPIDGRLPGSRPWDSPGKNTGVGCHFLLQCMKVTSESEVAQSCPTLATPWTVDYQAPPSMRFPRQEYWSGMPLPSPFNPSRLLQSPSSSSLHQTANSYWLSILHMVVCMLSRQKGCLTEKLVSMWSNYRGP